MKSNGEKRGGISKERSVSPNGRAMGDRKLDGIESGLISYVKQTAFRMAERFFHLLNERVGAADEPLRALHFRPHVRDCLHASKAGHCRADTAAEQPAPALENQATQPPGSRVLRRRGSGAQGTGNTLELHHQFAGRPVNISYRGGLATEAIRER